MASWKQVEKVFIQICDILGNPPIKLLRPSEFEKIYNCSLNSYIGRVGGRKKGEKFYGITLRYRKERLPSIRNTIYHEIAHILFPSKPHWWIECYAEKMSGYKEYNHYALKYSHTPKELPSKSGLLEMSRRATERLKIKLR